MNEYEARLSPEERRKHIYWLQKMSSYTAWARVKTYYDKWMEIFKQAYEEARPRSQYDFADYVNDFQRYCGMEECMRRLARGDKRQFRHLRLFGYFYDALLPISTWYDLLERARIGECVMHEPESPYWAEFEAAFKDLARVSAEVEYPILENDSPYDEPALLGMASDLGPDYLHEYTDFPDPLPPEPVPSETVLIKSKNTVPCTGIWEPVKVALSNGFMGRFRSPVAPADGQFEPDGFMNYLHRNTSAPNIDMPDDPDNTGRPTVWRLIWCDDRYKDGKIPAEEAEYTFRCPEHKAGVVIRQETYSARYDEWLARTASYRCPAGEVCPEEGYWSTPAKIDSRRRFKQGDILPELGSDYGATIWQWDANQAD